jgi:proteasome accessory factor B
MRMSAEKTERLINLTLGLLATKRYLTKNEIFRTIAGYSGTMESMERMFERDKDELRGAGIEIEVGGLDPLFEDEQGYLIRSGSIQIQPDDFTKQELMLMVIPLRWSLIPMALIHPSKISFPMTRLKILHLSFW